MSMSGTLSYKKGKVSVFQLLFSHSVQLIYFASFQDILIYTADNRNIHSVSEVLSPPPPPLPLSPTLSH